MIVPEAWTFLKLQSIAPYLNECGTLRNTFSSRKQKFIDQFIKGGEILDTEALNLSRSIVSLQSFGSMFRVSHLAWSIYPATKTFATGWRNEARWLVDLFGVAPRQVASLLKNEQQRQNLLLKVDPRSTFRNNFPGPVTKLFVARQVDQAR